MAGICCGLVNESETSTACEQSSRAARRRRMEIRRFKFVAGVATPEPGSTSTEQKRRKLEGYYTASFSRDCENAVEMSVTDEEKKVVENESLETKGISNSNSNSNDGCVSTSVSSEYPKFGVASVCGRRRDMEDAVAIHPSFSSLDHNSTTKLHYFGVYDGHGCSHVRVCFFLFIFSFKPTSKTATLLFGSPSFKIYLVFIFRWQRSVEKSYMSW